jgi:hypothetical protein
LRFNKVWHIYFSSFSSIALHFLPSAAVMVLGWRRNQLLLLFCGCLFRLKKKYSIGLYDHCDPLAHSDLVQYFIGGQKSKEMWPTKTCLIIQYNFILTKIATAKKLRFIFLILFYLFLKYIFHFIFDKKLLFIFML